MSAILDAIRVNPVRVYNFVAAVLAVAVYFAPDLPVPAILGAVAALLGVGEVVRSKVTPMERVLLHVNDVEDIGDDNPDEDAWGILFDEED